MVLLNIHMKDCHDDVDDPTHDGTDVSTNVPYHACHVCDEMFVSHSMFSRHMLEAHNGRTTFSCNLCKNAHNQVMNNQQKLFNCDHCAECFTEVIDLNVHIETVHEDSETQTAAGMSIPQLDGINDNLTPVHSAISSPGVNSGRDPRTSTTTIL